MWTNLADKLKNHGIELKRGVGPGSHKTSCPKCSRTRKDKRDPCLSVTIDPNGENAIWNCHNCNWAGTTRWDDQAEERQRTRQQPHVRPREETIERPTVEVMRWFLDRGIPAEVVQRNKIGFVKKHYIAKLGREVPCITFGYYRRGELVNVKYRALAGKGFAQTKDAEKIFYGLDDIAGAEDVVIVEGECDKLAFEVAGFRNVISVPDGAPKQLRDKPSDEDAKFEYLRNCAAQLEAVEGKFILAVDNDGPGKVLEEELARRLGKPLATSSRVGRLATIGGFVSRPSPRRPEMSGKRR